MKKTAFFILSAVLLVSCSKKVVVPEVPEGKEYIEISSAKERILPQTKAFFTDDKAISWNGEDAVVIYDCLSAEPNYFKVKDRTSAVTVTLAGAVTRDWNDLWAFTPTQAVTGIVDVGNSGVTAYVTVPALQKITQGKNVDSLAMVSVSHIGRCATHLPEASEFKSICSYINFTVGGAEVSEIVVTALNGDYLAGGNVRVILDNSGEVTSVDTTGITDGSRSVTLAPVGDYFTPGTQYFVPVLSKGHAGGNFFGGFRFDLSVGGDRYFTPYPVNTAINRGNGINLGQIDKSSRCSNVFPEITLNNVAQGPGTLTFEWEESDSDSGESGKPSNHYNISISEKNGTKVAEWLGVADTWLGAEAGKAVRFTWACLDPGTEYTCQVENAYNGRIQTCDGTTAAASQNVVIPSSEPAVGGVVLSEDFSEVVWGRDILNGAAGVFPKSSASRFSDDPFASSERPEAGADRKVYFISESARRITAAPEDEKLLFTDFASAVSDSRLAGWSELLEVADKNAVVAAPSHLCLGHNRYCGYICTPALSCLSGSDNVIRVTVEAARFGSDPRDVMIAVTDGTPTLISDSSVKIQETYQVDGEPLTPTTHSVIISGVSPSTKIIIGSVRGSGAAGGADRRIVVKNVKIEYLGKSNIDSFDQEEGYTDFN